MQPFQAAEFHPHRLVRGGHAQTLAGFYLPTIAYPYQAEQQLVELDDGDQIVLHEDTPDAWLPGDKTALLVHGLAGCHQSGYMQRIAARLVARGVRAYRLDMRGCGASFPIAQHPAHSGRTADLEAALRAVAQHSPRSPTTLVGFSLEGNVALNLAAEAGRRDLGNLERTIAVCPPIDLARCSRQIERGTARIYGAWFVRLLMQHLERRRLLQPAWPAIQLAARPRTLWEFDHAVTAPMCGYASAAEYYERTSPGPRLKQIELPTLIVASRDDPLVPIGPFQQHARSSAVQLLITRGGGHLGFISRVGGDADRRWLDWRIVDWVLE